ncbi:MAG: hypothetical protein LBQ79_10585 [Deltaproteobacteria bacterium]|jgi:hypothetical protein|nr:hypothetical protein [Deltaproteobacteria bacterium]
MTRPSAPKRPGAFPAAALALALALPLLSPAALSAQGLDPAIFEGQGPVTLADVPAALAALRELTGERPDPARLEAIAREHGTTQARLAFLTIKFQGGAALLAPDGPTAAQLEADAGTPLAIPTPAELEVIRAAFGQMTDLESD